MLAVVGIDVAKNFWVAVALLDGHFFKAERRPNFAEILHLFPDAAVVAVDVPIGLPDQGRRAPDQPTRDFVGRRKSSVFYIPPRTCLEADSYPAALAESRRLTGKGLSRQAYALRNAIFEVERHLDDGRLIEVHPEASFRAMAGRPLDYAKKKWGGAVERLELLRAEGICLPDDLGDEANRAEIDDVLDAAAAAWSGARFALGRATSLPDPPAVATDGRPFAIWY